jgi:diguanylate cyclase (GGDEF)-like protein
MVDFGQVTADAARSRWRKCPPPRNGVIVLDQQRQVIGLPTEPNASGALDPSPGPAVVDSEGRLIVPLAAAPRTAHDEIERMLSTIEQLDHAATHDPLTGLPNRLGLARRFESIVATADGCSMLYLDLDGFKPVNDRFGHAVGDAVLCVVATRLQGAVRRTDLIARVGGDEFVMLVPGRERRTTLLRIARQIDRCLETPLAVGPMRARLCASIGVATIGAGGTLEQLMDEADAAMYAAKRARNPHRSSIAPTCTV